MTPSHQIVVLVAVVLFGPIVRHAMSVDEDIVPCDFGDLIDHGAENGREIKIGTMDAYLSDAVDVEGEEKIAIMVYHDIFGWKLPNTRVPTPPPPSPPIA